jgi:hypothetical protein
VGMGWNEPAATNALVEDEPVQPVLRMNILPARGVFFFISSLPHLPPPSYPPSYLPPPTYHLRTPPPVTPSPKLELWSGSSSCGVVAVELWSCARAVELLLWSCARAVELLLWSRSRSSSAHETHAPTIR